MTAKILSREQIRRVDAVAIQQWGVSGLMLMENAGRGVADHLCECGIQGQVLIACSKGNNGGDGFVIARHLQLRGYAVEVLACFQANELQGDAAANFRLLQRTSVPIRQLASTPLDQLFETAEWAVDALLGTGAQGAPRSPLAEVIQAMNTARVRRYAVDVPSGVDCDSGKAVAEAFRADHTGTFVAMKPGLLASCAQDHVGKVRVLDIGLPWELVQAAVSGDPDGSAVS